jgi:NarL family two-component system response regulator LiaR
MELENRNFENMKLANNRIRVLLVDDHAVVRGGLRFYLSSRDDIDLVGEADNGEVAVLMCDRFHPDVVLMDLMMPRMNGVDATRLIRQRHPKTQVIALTSFQEDKLIHDVLGAGAIGYLLKSVAAKELIEAIRAAHEGRSTLAPEVVQHVITMVTRPPQLGNDLTEREIDVLRLLATGLSNSEIAGQLIITRNTVRHHIRNILSKLGATNRTEAVVLAIQHGLVPGSTEERYASHSDGSSNVASRVTPI